jgi:hypothetical protein
MHTYQNISKTLERLLTAFEWRLQHRGIGVEEAGQTHEKGLCSRQRVILYGAGPSRVWDFSSNGKGAKPPGKGTKNL